MVSAPFDDLLQNGLVNLSNTEAVSHLLPNSGKQRLWEDHAAVLTFGSGTGSSVVPRSSSMFLIKTERSATSRSILEVSIDVMHKTSQSNKTSTTEHLPTVISTPSELWRVMVLAEAILGVDEVPQEKQVLLYEEIYLSSAKCSVSSSAPSDKAVLGLANKLCRGGRNRDKKRAEDEDFYVPEGDGEQRPKSADRCLVRRE